MRHLESGARLAATATGCGPRRMSEQDGRVACCKSCASGNRSSACTGISTSGEARLGRCLSLNPGSEYSDGVLRGVIVGLNGKKGVRGYQLVSG
jgi:hypothetical protein